MYKNLKFAEKLQNMNMFFWAETKKQKNKKFWAEKGDDLLKTGIVQEVSGLDVGMWTPLLIRVVLRYLLSTSR